MTPGSLVDELYLCANSEGNRVLQLTIRILSCLLSSQP